MDQKQVNRFKPKRRLKGEGSVYYRESDGRWVGVLSLGYDDNGKRKTKYFYGKTAQEARQKLQQAKSDLARGLIVDAKLQTIQTFLNGWLESRSRRRKPRTYEYHSDIVRLHLIPALGRIHLQKLNQVHVQKLLDTKLDSGLSAQSVSHIRTVLRTALQHAVKMDLVNRNVAALVDPIPVPRYIPKVLTKEQALKFLETAKGHRFAAIFGIALNLGLRRGEVLGLAWAGIDFENKRIHVTQAVQRINGTVQICPLKTEKSRRVISMTESVFMALQRQQSIHKVSRHDLVFTKDSGEPLDPAMIGRDYKKLLEKAGLDSNTRFHDLRHCCATILLQAGVGLKALGDLLGHQNITTTANIYSHVTDSMRQETSSTMDKLLGSV